MKTIIFTAKGAYARYRCPHTTTSALTYSIMHPIAIKGMIGAIMGIEYDKLYEYTNGMKIGVQLLSPIKKDMQSFNLIAQTNNNNAGNFQSRIEFLRDVKYRIFIADEDDEKLNEIKSCLCGNRYVFTPYLGASEHVAKLEFESILDAVIEDGTKNIFDTAIPKHKAELSIVEDSCIRIYTDRIPIKNDKSREYVKYENVVFSDNVKIIGENCACHRVGGYNVYFL